MHSLGKTTISLVVKRKFIYKTYFCYIFLSDCWAFGWCKTIANTVHHSCKDPTKITLLYSHFYTVSSKPRPEPRPNVIVVHFDCLH